MNLFLQTLIITVVILGTIAIIYFSFRSFIRTITGKGVGCHGVSDSECEQCDLVKKKEKVW